MAMRNEVLRFIFFTKYCTVVLQADHGLDVKTFQADFLFFWVTEKTQLHLYTDEPPVGCVWGHPAGWYVGGSLKSILPELLFHIWFPWTAQWL